MNLRPTFLILALLLVAPHAFGGVITFEEGIGGYAGTLDINIRQDEPESNREGFDTLTVGFGTVQALIRFEDIFGQAAIPLDATINSATVGFETTSAISGTISFHRMLTNWDSVTTWNDFGGDGVTPNGVEAIAATSATIIGPGLGLQEIDVTNDLRTWQSGTENAGWVALSNSTSGWEFVSSDFVGGPQRPRLSVNFTAIPEPSSILLLSSVSVISFLRLRLAPLRATC